jgi:hypothetical protein
MGVIDAAGSEYARLARQCAERAIYCGSPMRQRRFSCLPFANPFKLRRNDTEAERTECVAMYERWLTMQPALLAQLNTLAGHDLACWCAPLPCHCDVLLKLANGRRDDWRTRRPRSVTRAHPINVDAIVARQRPDGIEAEQRLWIVQYGTENCQRGAKCAQRLDQRLTSIRRTIINRDACAPYDRVAGRPGTFLRQCP